MASNGINRQMIGYEITSIFYCNDNWYRGVRNVLCKIYQGLSKSVNPRLLLVAVCCYDQPNLPGFTHRDHKQEYALNIVDMEDRYR